MVVLVTACGAPKEGGPASKAKPKGKFEISARLTEEEVTKFIRAFPILVEEAEKHGKALKRFEGKGPLAAMGAYGEIVTRYKDLEATVKAKTGQSIEDIFSAYFKIIFALSALSVQEGLVKYDEGVKDLEGQLKNPNLPESQRKILTHQLELARQTKASMDTLFKDIPSENIELVKKYKVQLKELFRSLE